MVKTTKGASTTCNIGQIAKAMLSGSLNYLQGAEQLVDMRDEMGIYANDPDFLIFLAVLSEVDYLCCPNGVIDWTLKYEGVDKKKLEESIAWAKEVSWEQCESLARRYGEA